MNKQQMLEVVSDQAQIADELRIVRTGDEYKVFVLCSDGAVEINSTLRDIYKSINQKNKTK